MILDLTRSWATLKDFTNLDLWSEFKNIRDWWNDHDSGSRAWNNVKTANLTATNATITNETVTNQTITNSTITNLTTQNINGTFVGLGRNRIINGEMLLDQANGGASVTVNATSQKFLLDTWSGFGAAADGVFTVAQTASSPPTGFSKYLHLAVTTADASIGASQYYALENHIEGYMVRDFLFGTSSAKTITISFWVRSSLTGTFSGVVYNNASNRSYPYTYVINSANTWEQKTVTLTGDLTGTWENTTNTGIIISFSVGIGSNFQGTAGSWSGSFLGGATGATQIISTVNATWDITGFQVEIGSTATAFEYRPFEIELALAQRYYEKSFDIDTAPTGASSFFETVSAFGATSYISGLCDFRVSKRATPTITTYSGTGVSGKQSWVNSVNTITEESGSVAAQSIYGFVVLETNAVYSRVGMGWVADARL